MAFIIKILIKSLSNVSHFFIPFTEDEMMELLQSWCHGFLLLLKFEMNVSSWGQVTHNRSGLPYSLIRGVRLKEGCVYTSFTFLSGKWMWVKVGGIWLSKTSSKQNVEIVKVQDSILKTNQWNFENIFLFGPKYL